MMNTSEQEPIAVIGMACRFPGGSNSPSKLWDLLQSPRDLSKRVPTERFDSTGYFHPNGSQHGATDSREAYFLDEDVTRFDNGFFNIQPAEVEAIDPQQRLIMETVYDSLCAGGQTIEGLRGSNTAVYVGLMCDDWAQLINRDWDLMPTYSATGESRAIISNRVSYFFDWRGPSMTIDTACSSSLVAVHQGVTALRNGECPIAIAAGANLILAPGMWIAESNLHMLSPTGSSKMWDAKADGYARGEGIAAVVLKPLSAALRDGDHIDCVIRGTGVNQDGKTSGLTMPNNIAQADLIRDTYARAGLNIDDVKDRPQFFHAHGTGTPAGDPQEAEAISRSFFRDRKVTDTLYVGSIKTILGHTEGAAGLASLVGTALAMQHRTIPPNLHFHNLSPRVAPFYNHLEVPTSAKPWPSPVSGQPRRASINSFGFGGTNAHAIIESFEPVSVEQAAVVPAFAPLTISAASSFALRAMLTDLRAYLQNHPDINMRDLAYTLQTRRSTLAFRKAIMCANIEEAVGRIDGLLTDDASGENGLASLYFDVPKPGILGVFTGQGAQWPRMGARLIEQSPYVAQRIAELQRALSTLPDGDRPDWTLCSQLLANSQVSRLSEAAIAQPLCTAVQIVLVDLLRAANIQLRAVVGHSSGEIAAAYAAGFLSATDAIRIAYYRGLFAKLARSPSEGSARGAMMAVGTSFEDASEFCALEDFTGRIQVAARNSSTSMTLSGDEDAIEEAVAIFKDEGQFARQLRVDTAYHSHHMKPCAEPYLDALARCKVAVGDGNGTAWFSSVVEGQVMSKEALQPQYWVDNMTNAVLFAPAVAKAVANAGPFDIGLEFGPHPALKGPCLDTLEEATGNRIPYTGLLGRNKNDIDELALALGFVWTQLGASSVDFDGFEKQISGTSHPKRFLADLPTYPFDHTRSFYSLSRFSGGHQNIHAPQHPLLGRRCVEVETADEISWRNVLRPSENSWLQGHQLQGQSVFPAMGYVAMAVEAATALAGTDRKLGLINLEDVVIGRALAFGDDSVGMESKVTMNVVRSTDEELYARITCHSGLPFDNAAPLVLNFSATVTVVFQEPAPDTLPAVRVDEINLVDAEPERLYSQFTKLGYNYSPPFTGVRAIQRKMGFATGDIEDESGDGWEDQLLVHPGWLDSAIQTGFAAYSHPHDGRLFTLYVPTAIRSVVVNPYFFTTPRAGMKRHFQYQSVVREAPEAPMVVDIDLFSGEGQSHAFVQFESVEVKPFAAASPRDDAIAFSRSDYRLAGPDAVAAAAGDDILLPENAAALIAAERVAFFHLRRLHETIAPAEKANTLPHYQRLLNFAAHMVDAVSRGEHPHVPHEAITDSPAFVRSLIAKYHDRVYVRMLDIVGEHLAAEVRRGGSMLEHMIKDRLLDQFYEELAGQSGQENPNAWIGRVVAQLVHRFPRLHILEIGASTGSLAHNILPILGDAFATYTYTDISAEGFDHAQERFRDFADRLVFATYDMERPPEDQGFEEGTYDVVLASAVLHTTGQLDNMMANLRRFLRPGGFLIALEAISNDFLSLHSILGSLPSWWAGAATDPSRQNGPCLTLDQWDTLARRHGFSGVDTHTPIEHKLQRFSVFTCQAVDDRVRSLLDPLAAPALALNASPNSLIVVGGGGGLVEKTCELLRQRYSTITRLESLEELNTRGLATGSSVLSLTELDQQFLEIRSAAKLEALKTLWRHGRSILWVTRGARDERPYSSILLGLARVVRFEYPNISLQVLDFDSATMPTPEILAETLLHLELGTAWKKEEGVNLLWSMEPEIHYVEGRQFIPRLYPDTAANQRYNTYRRTLLEEVDPQKSTVVLEPAPDEKTFELCTVSPLRVPPAPRKGKTITLRVEQSLLQVIKIHNAGFFNLCAGTAIETGESLIALLDTPIESRVSVPVEWTVVVPERERKLAESHTALSAVAAHLLAQSILAAAPAFGTVLVHEADEVLKDSLEREAAREDMRVVFTTAVKKTKTKTKAEAITPYVFIHKKLPVRLVQRLVPRGVSLFVNLSPASAGAELLLRCLPPHTTIVTATEFLRTQPGVSPDTDIDETGRVLQAAWQAVKRQRQASTLAVSVPILPLQDVASHSAINEGLRIIDWNTSSVQVSLRAIDAGTIFRADGTYLLIGLTGELGQSLCRWMVTHGARHIVLGSRRPQVQPQYIEHLESLGAAIKVVAVDVTQRDSLRACHDAIRVEMPPIIGVANGAMLLEDAMFDDLEFASLERTAPPKIDGSMLLDELFYNVPLDFFILFTSTACVAGNSGQSAYVMANQFMAALAAQRRDVRGVAGSDIALASVQGLGYFQHADRLDRDHFSRMGYRNSSEQEFHQLFAEAILAGRPGSGGSSEIGNGYAPFHDGPNIQAQLRTDPRFGHFKLQDASAAGLHGGNSNSKTARPRARLATVKSRAEALAVVQDAFVDRLKRILMVPQGEPLNEKVTFVEQGVDSIMAVEVRAWFLQEFDVDMPVLKILGAGSTVESLLEEVMGQIPATILDWEQLGDGDAVDVHGGKTAALPSSQTARAASTSTDSLPALSTPATPPETEAETEAEEEKKLGKTPDWRKAIVDSSTELTVQMTYGQERFWFLSHYIDDPTTFNVSYMGKLTGPLRIDDLARAVELVAQRHETLRTRFFWSDDESKTPMQGILSNSLVRLETATIESEAQAARELDAMRDYEWNLGDWVPLRLRLLSLSATVHYILIGTHHISLDGHSLSVLMHDINEAYQQRPLPLLPDASQVRAFGEQQRTAYKSGKLQPDIDYYRAMLPTQTLARPIELFSFARTQVRPPLDRYDTHVARLRLEPEFAAKLNQLARGRRSTSFHAYLAAFQALLFRLLPADTTDTVVVGIADANRLDHKFMGSIGNFLNVLPIRFDRAHHQTFGEAIELARKKTYGALEHSGLPFDLLLDELAVPRSNAWSPVFQVFVDYRLLATEQVERSWAGCRIEENKWYASRSGYDVALEIVEDQEGALLVVHVQKTLYNGDGAELLLRSYANVLREVAKHGDLLNVEQLEKWDQRDVKTALDLGKGPEMQLEWPATVAHHIDQVIAQYPGSIALKDDDGHVLTYAAMDQRVESIACALRDQLPTGGDQHIVGVFQMPSVDWICSLIAIHRVGAVYLPLDLRNSVPRLKSAIAATRPAAILTDRDTTGRTEEIGVDKHTVVINVSDLAATTAGVEKEPTASRPDRPAYIIFTSGSTGEPKGIVVTHAGLRAHLEGLLRAWPIPAHADVVLQQAAFSFDASLLQIYAALTTGGCLLVVPADARGDPAEVTRLMADHSVTLTHATPSEYDMWFRFAPDTLRRCFTWKAAWFGGERATSGLLARFRELSRALPNLQVFTSYGPTETTISAMKGKVDVDDPTLTVPVPGRVLPNYAAYIVDDEIRPVPIGVPGEIVLGGAGVDQNEYLHRPDLTAAQFLADPFTTHHDHGWGRMYRTGDYGRLDTRGYLAIEGRVAGDTQVKLRGFRIELAGIESAMIKEAGGTLSHAVVTLRGDGEQDGFLAAHVVFEKKNQSEEEKAVLIDRLRVRLPLCLPPYMCPAVIVPINDVPLTAHHKVDRKAVQTLPLPKFEETIVKQRGQGQEPEAQAQNLTPTERRLADLWAAVLPPYAVSVPLAARSDFFRAGGNSLLLVKLQAAIKRAYGDAPRLSKLLSAPELGSMAALLDSGVAAADWDKEMALDLLDEVPVQQPRAIHETSGGLRVLVTGATGSLGGPIVSNLAADERVAQIVCLARPAEGRDLMNLFPSIKKEKIRVVSADLPSLPAHSDLSKIDVVLHCAADRNFWDGYGAVKPVNVDAAKALARLCLRIGATLHVLTSGAVAAYEADGDDDNRSGQSLLPRPNPADGYVASKWVAERYLARAARQAGLRVTAHRPTKVAADDDDQAEEKEREAEAAMAHEMLLISARLGARPGFAHLGGTLDVAPLKDVAEAVAAAVTAGTELEEEAAEKKQRQKRMRVVNYPGSTRLRAEVVAKYMAELLGRPDNETVRKLPVVSALHWVGLAKRAGLFEWFITAQELVMEDEDGRKVVTRR